jgi:large subunit ribosomal protein L23
MSHSHDIIIRPVLTERSYDNMAHKKYTFIVAPDANKFQIKKAVEDAFGVKVEKVNTLNRPGHIKRQGKTSGMTSDTKRAIVKLTASSKGIEFFEGMAQQEE